jgi:hypothetical protein
MLKTYDPKLVLVSFGEVAITGFAEGTFVAVARDEDAFSKLVGSGGDVVRSRNRNRSGSVTVTLIHGAPENDLLAAIAVQDELSGTGVRPVMVKEANGTTLCAGQSAWVRKSADAEYAKEAGSREWTFDVAELDMYVGGLAT